MLTLLIRLINSADCSQLSLTDVTGAYNAGNNPGGWNSPNISPSQVASVFLGGFYQEDNCTPTVTIPTFMLMPTVSAPLPYALPQGFLLTPSMFGMTTPTFPAGIYTLTFSVWTSGTMIFNLQVGSPNLQVGDIVTDSLGNQIYILTTNGVTQATFYTLSNTTLASGNASANPSGATIIISTDITQPVQYTATQQFLVKCSIDCCIGQKLSALPDCGCNKEDLDKLFDNFMELMAAEAQVGCMKNSEALDTIENLTDYCNGCGCGCH